jgi:hypothetical protein
MERSNVFRVLLGCLLLGSVIATGCKKEEDPVDVPVPSASQAAATPPPAPEPAASASEAPSATEAPTAAPPPVAVTTATAAKKGESIDACCSALRAVQKSGKTAIAKSRAAAAAGVCPGVAKLVKDGTVTRSAGLTQVRSSLGGSEAPAECR